MPQGLKTNSCFSDFLTFLAKLGNFCWQLFMAAVTHTVKTFYTLNFQWNFHVIINSYSAFSIHRGDVMNIAKKKKFTPTLQLLTKICWNKHKLLQSNQTHYKLNVDFHTLALLFQKASKMNCNLPAREPWTTTNASFS